MIKNNDHDILLELRTDVKYIKTFVKNNTKSIEGLNTRVNNVEDWQEQTDGKMKVLVGVATFIGGIVVFIGNKLWDFFRTRQ